MSARVSRYLIGAGSAALAIGLGALPVLAMMPSAQAAGSGANAKGSLTVHAEGTSIVDENNEPHVCGFRLVADNYDPSLTLIHYTFERYDTNPNQLGLAPGTISLTGGEGQTAVLSLPNGHYKPHGQESAEAGADNFKAFWVECDAPGPTPTTPAPTVAPTTPAPTVAPTTPAPTVAPTTPAPTVAPTTPAPTEAPTTPAPTVAPTTPAPTAEPVSPAPIVEPTTPAPAIEPTEPPFTGGGGLTPDQPVVQPPAVGGGTAAELPRTGQYTGSLVGWALAAIIAGLGMILAGTVAPKHARR
jgi:hypothetical protein